MATGVKPRDEESHFTRSDLEAIQDAMKSKKFREMLSEYCEEVRDPANQAIYQQEMTQLEKERGYDVTFINPKGSYVIKTSVAGDRKAFINICSNENVGKPSYNIQEANGKRGMNWQIPYSIIPPREDYDSKKERCVIYDVVYHPDTLRMAEVNKQFRELVNKTAVDGLQNAYNIHLDSNNFRYPKSHYKGMTVPAVIRKEDPNFKPPEEDEDGQLPAEVLEKLYPQQLYPEKSAKVEQVPHNDAASQQPAKKCNKEFVHSSENGYTIPKYVIKQQKNVDLQDFTYDRDSKQYSAIPSHIVVEINLPLLSSTKDCILDVHERSLNLLSEKPAKYKLEINLPYSVNDECGNAKFDKSKRKLIVTLPVIKKNLNNGNTNYLRLDSGVESEENSGSQSDEENNNKRLIVEVSSSVHDTTLKPADKTESPTNDTFFETAMGYTLPPYTYNGMDDILAFTFHVKNTEPESVKVKNIDNKIYIKFTSIGSGFVPVHYAAIIIFDKSIKFSEVNGEAWDNNVILQLDLEGQAPHQFQIGNEGNSMVTEYLDFSQVKKSPKVQAENDDDGEALTPVVEVTNLGSETNIVVSSNNVDYEEDNSEVFKDKKIVWIGNNCENEAKSILRKPESMMRSYSESSVGDVASSMDYISSDCIPEESSLKKTVRFNDVIARQFYRYNSSIEGQKKKNQRKKSKKRSQERRKSESEAEEESRISSQSTSMRLKSALKQRRDSGLADTSDAEAECKLESFNTASEDCEPKSNNINFPNSMLDIVSNAGKVKAKLEADIWESEDKIKKETKSDLITCENIKHNTKLYDPDRLNKGQYLEVMFKNDLIFDLDM